MRGLDPTRKRLAAARVCGDEIGAVEDPDGLLVNRDVDVIAHELIRHAVAHGFDIDEGIAGHASAQALLPTRQRTRRQWTKGGLLIADEAITRPLVRRAVHALV